MKIFSPIKMKIENIGYIFFFENIIIYTSGFKKVIKYNFYKNEKIEIELHSNIESAAYSYNSEFLINTLRGSILFDFDLKKIGAFDFGYTLNNKKFKKYIFANSNLQNVNFKTNLNWQFNEEKEELIQLPVKIPIFDYIFHDQYFIPITFRYASSMSFGSDFTVYNYNGEAVWSKSFKDKSIYDPAASLTDAEVANVNISSIKIVADTVIVTGSNKHAFCFNIHTGEQIWRQAGFTNLLVGIAVVDETEGYLYTHDQEHFSKIDIKTGQIVHKVKIEEWLSARLAVNKTAYSLAADGIWVAGQTNGVVGRINKETLLVDLTYNLVSHGTISGSYAPHVTNEFVMIPDGLGNLEVIKRE